MANRYFVRTDLKQLEYQSGYAEKVLEGPEAHHVANVMRQLPGDKLIVFDGCGHEATAEIVEVSKSKIRLAISSPREINRELDIALHVGVSLPKPDRQKFLVEKLNEIGVKKIYPLICQRSTVRAVHSFPKFERWIIESSKQCLRNQLMETSESMHWNDWLTLPGDGDAKWLCHASGSGVNLTNCQPSSNAVWLAIGPEGGFDESELDLARSADWQLLSFGPRILRIETAAIMAASLASLHASLSRPATG